MSHMRITASKQINALLKEISAGRITSITQRRSSEEYSSAYAPTERITDRSTGSGSNVTVQIAVPSYPDGTADGGLGPCTAHINPMVSGQSVHAVLGSVSPVEIIQHRHFEVQVSSIFFKDFSERHAGSGNNAL